MFHWGSYVVELRRTNNPVGIEAIATMHRFVMDTREIRAYCCSWTSMRPETLQLGVMSIASGPSQQHRLGQECFSPAGHQSLAIKQSRM